MNNRAAKIRSEKIETFAEIHEGLKKAIGGALEISCNKTASPQNRIMALRAAAEATETMMKLDKQIAIQQGIQRFL